MTPEGAKLFNGSLLRREIQVQWPASTDRVKQHRKLGWRGRW
jgi:hypothetical protein